MHSLTERNPANASGRSCLNETIRTGYSKLRSGDTLAILAPILTNPTSGSCTAHTVAFKITKQPMADLGYTVYRGESYGRTFHKHTGTTFDSVETHKETTFKVLFYGNCLE